MCNLSSIAYNTTTMNEVKSDNKPIVLSVGGSLIVPNGGINTAFLKNLNACIRDHVKR